MIDIIWNAYYLETYVKIYNYRICTINIVNDTFLMIILRKIT